MTEKILSNIIHLNIFNKRSYIITRVGKSYIDRRLRYLREENYTDRRFFRIMVKHVI